MGDTAVSLTYRCSAATTTLTTPWRTLLFRVSLPFAPVFVQWDLFFSRRGVELEVQVGTLLKLVVVVVVAVAGLLLLALEVVLAVVVVLVWCGVVWWWLCG